MATSNTHGLLDFLRKQIQRFEKNHILLIENGPPDAVHDFRVASRRLREPLEILRRTTSPRRVRKAGKKLRQARNAVRELRDVDVLMAALQQPLKEIDDQHRRAFIDALARKRNALLKAGRRQIDSLDVAGTIKSLHWIVGKLEKNYPGNEAFVSPVLDERNQRIEGILLRITQQPINWHGIRLQIKRVRYLTELLGNLTPRDDCKRLADMRAMQTRLGDYNDHRVALVEATRLATSEQALSFELDFTMALLGYARFRAEGAARLLEDARRHFPEFAVRIGDALEERDGATDTIGDPPTDANNTRTSS